MGTGFYNLSNMIKNIKIWTKIFKKKQVISKNLNSIFFGKNLNSHFY